MLSKEVLNRSTEVIKRCFLGLVPGLILWGALGGTASAQAPQPTPTPVPLPFTGTCRSGVRCWEIKSTSGTAISGDSSTTTVSQAGVAGASSSPFGFGVLGLHSGNGVGVFGGGVTGVKGESNRDGGIGVLGRTTSASLNSFGVIGDSKAGSGVGGYGATGVQGESDRDGGIGVLGRTTSTSLNSFGVKGESKAGTGVYGRSDLTGSQADGRRIPGGIGVHGENNELFGIGVKGASSSGDGVNGISGSGNGVKGTSSSGDGVNGISDSGKGVTGHSKSGKGVEGSSLSGIGVRGSSSNSVGVWAEGASLGLNGVALRANNGNASGIGIFSTTKSNDSNLVLTNEGRGDLIRGFSGAGGSNLVFRVLNNGTAVVREMQTRGADLAERFEFSEEAKPGMVVAIDPDNPGKLRIARGAYNPTVAGVISGANDLSAGIVLSQDTANGYPVALSGRVWVYCDAAEGAITPGALLTTAERHGYAMAARNHKKAPGAIIGKAMTSLKEGIGLVLVLVTLQ